MKRLCGYLVLILSLTIAWASPAAAQQRGDAFHSTEDYVSQFYPLWFTFNQTRLAEPNRIVGPDNISPIYHYVVAINDDTVYASSFLDLSVEPVILTIPTTSRELLSAHARSVLRYIPFRHPATRAGGVRIVRS